jgi:hypothetical protein
VDQIKHKISTFKSPILIRTQKFKKLAEEPSKPVSKLFKATTQED